MSPSLVMSPGSSAAIVTPPDLTMRRRSVLRSLGSAFSFRSRTSICSVDSADDKDALLLSVDSPPHRPSPPRRSTRRRIADRRRIVDAAEGNEWNVPCCLLWSSLLMAVLHYKCGGRSTHNYEPNWRKTESERPRV